MSDIKKSKIPFINLHGHTTFSTYDAIGFPKDAMEFAYNNGMNALAITDHGNCNALPYQIEAQQMFDKAGKDFKSIFGIEAYFVPSVKDWSDLRLTVESDKKKKKSKKRRNLNGNRR